MLIFFSWNSSGFILRLLHSHAYEIYFLEKNQVKLFCLLFQMSYQERSFFFVFFFFCEMLITVSLATLAKLVPLTIFRNLSFFLFCKKEKKMKYSLNANGIPTCIAGFVNNEQIELMVGKSIWEKKK